MDPGHTHSKPEIGGIRRAMLTACVELCATAACRRPASRGLSGSRASVQPRGAGFSACPRHRRRDRDANGGGAASTITPGPEREHHCGRRRALHCLATGNVLGERLRSRPWSFQDSPASDPRASQFKPLGPAPGGERRVCVPGSPPLRIMARVVADRGGSRAGVRWSRAHARSCHCGTYVQAADVDRRPPSRVPRPPVSRARRWIRKVQRDGKHRGGLRPAERTRAWLDRGLLGLRARRCPGALSRPRTPIRLPRRVPHRSLRPVATGDRREIVSYASARRSSTATG
jgi:hypothetical protein